jgi:poly-gamma-glutamate synthesis protein (capsule biosynthesis protein)
MRRLALLAVTAVALVSVSMGGAADPGFRGRAEPIPASLRARMTSWHRGCPVGIERLRLLTLSYWGFDGRGHAGRLVVAATQTRAVLRVMRRLYEARFPIRRMQLVERYGADDDRSMAADNTSGFFCRPIRSGGRWSAHAFGLAIDINPVENPYITSGEVAPPAGAAFVDRSQYRKGMIHAGDAVVRAFAAAGWKWGGYWRYPKDYQHFSATGT